MGVCVKSIQINKSIYILSKIGSHVFQIILFVQTDACHVPIYYLPDFISDVINLNIFKDIYTYILSEMGATFSKPKNIDVAKWSVDQTDHFSLVGNQLHMQFQMPDFLLIPRYLHFDTESYSFNCIYYTNKCIVIWFFKNDFVNNRKYYYLT